MIVESTLQLHEGNAVDESIKSYEYNEYQPITGTQLSSDRQITTTIEYQDQFIGLHSSYLLIEGYVSKADNTRYADADLIALTNNGLVNLFSSLKLTMTDGGTCQLSRSGYTTSRFGDLLARLFKRMWIDTLLDSRH